MADFLIYNTNHWTKEVSLEDKAKWTGQQEDKFANVHEFDDIVEVQPDGFYKKRGYNKKVFRVIENPKLSYEKYEVLMHSVEHTFPAADGKFYHKYRRRGKVDALDNIIDKLGKL